MLKGINKQINEIKCTDNEYFDKILLFVNSDKSHLPPEILRKNAVEIASIITGEQRPYENRKYNPAMLTFTLMGAAVLVMLLIALCM